MYKKYLTSVNPKLCMEWHPKKNAPLTPSDVTYGSGIKIWWICKKGHEWEASVFKRNEGQGCPYCSGRKVCDDNSLKTLRPDISNQWNKVKNGTLTPQNAMGVGPREVLDMKRISTNPAL